MTTVAVDVVYSIAVEEAGAARGGPHAATVAAVETCSTDTRHFAELTHQRNVTVTHGGW